jgi:hypothetical protein
MIHALHVVKIAWQTNQSYTFLACVDLQERGINEDLGEYLRHLMFDKEQVGASILRLNLQILGCTS